MKLTRLAGLLAVAVTVGSITAAFADGYFPKWPIVGGAAYCALFAGDGTTCVENVPAGPSIVTGNESIPTDTHLANGSSPQTVLLKPVNLNANPLTYSTISATAQTITPAATSGGVFVHSTAVGGTITAITINLPAAPIDGQQFAISADNTLTSLTVQTNNLPNASTTIKNNPSVLTVSTTGSFGYLFWYNAANNVWSRLQ